MVNGDDRLVLLGRVVGVHGVRGGVKIESYTEPRAAILDYQPWILRQHGAESELRARPISRHGKIAATLDGIDDRDQAAALLGAELLVRRRQLPAPAPGEYYWTDLEGLSVVNTEGLDLGRVQRLFETGANPVMVVHDGERERLLPFVIGAHVREVDLAAGRILVDWDADF